MAMRRPRRYHQRYIGDAVYVYLSEHHNVVLYTSDGVEETNRVVLEPAVLRQFKAWLRELENEEGNTHE